MMKKIQLEKLKNIKENIDLDVYIKFRESVKSSMPYPDWLGDFTKEELSIMIEKGTTIWMFYSKTIPVCSMMLIPSSKKALEKFELNLDYHTVVDYGPMFVNNDFIGNGLQLQMLKFLDEYASKKGYEYAICTVHPENIYSYQNLIKDNFSLVKEKKFSRGIRNIYIKKLK